MMSENDLNSSLDGVQYEEEKENIKYPPKSKHRSWAKKSIFHPSESDDSESRWAKSHKRHGLAEERFIHQTASSG